MTDQKPPTGLTRRTYPHRSDRPTLSDRLLVPVLFVMADLQDTMLWLAWWQARRSAERHMRAVGRLRDVAPEAPDLTTRLPR